MLVWGLRGLPVFGLGLRFSMYQSYQYFIHNFNLRNMCSLLDRINEQRLLRR